MPIAWRKISDDDMPPEDVPVWLYDPAIGQPLIGCLTYDDGLEWERLYDDYWYDDADGNWNTSHTNTETDPEWHPTHWLPLPVPPLPPKAG